MWGLVAQLRVSQRTAELTAEAKRARAAFDTVTEIIAERTGIRTHLGKCRCWNAQRGAAPPGIASLGAEVWRGDRAPEERGIVVLGTPVGTPEFLRAHATSRLAREEVFGPVVVVIPFDTDEEAIAMANDSDYGLTGAVWTADTDRGMWFAERAEVGTFWIKVATLIHLG